MTDGTAANPRAKGWDVWLVRLAMLLGIGAPLAGLAMALLTGAGLLDFSISLGSLRWLSYAAMAGCVLALVLMLLFALRRRWSRTLLPLLTVVIAAAFVGMLSYNFGKAEIVPPIHDVTTDLANPPQFVSLTERADNLDVVPDGGVPQLAAMSNAERWRFFHLREYGDIQPITVPANVQQTVDAARGLVEERGWDPRRRRCSVGPGRGDRDRLALSLQG